MILFTTTLPDMDKDGGNNDEDNNTISGCELQNRNDER